MGLDEEAGRATNMLKGKVVARVMLHRADEVVIEFADGGRMFVDSQTALQLSITL